VKSEYDGTAKDFFSFSGRFLVILALAVEGPRDFEGFPIMAGFLSIWDFRQISL
jgi:hypothetical protein